MMQSLNWFEQVQTGSSIIASPRTLNWTISQSYFLPKLRTVVQKWDLILRNNRSVKCLVTSLILTENFCQSRWIGFRVKRNLRSFLYTVFPREPHLAFLVGCAAHFINKTTAHWPRPTAIRVVGAPRRELRARGENEHRQGQDLHLVFCTKVVNINCSQNRWGKCTVGSRCKSERWQIWYGICTGSCLYRYYQGVVFNKDKVNTHNRRCERMKNYAECWRLL